MHRPHGCGLSRHRFLTPGHTGNRYNHHIDLRQAVPAPYVVHPELLPAAKSAVHNSDTVPVSSLPTETPLHKAFPSAWNPLHKQVLLFPLLSVPHGMTIKYPS